MSDPQVQLNGVFYTNLAEALQNASSEDVVSFEDGLYTELDGLDWSGFGGAESLDFEGITVDQSPFSDSAGGVETVLQPSQAFQIENIGSVTFNGLTFSGTALNPDDSLLNTTAASSGLVVLNARLNGGNAGILAGAGDLTVSQVETNGITGQQIATSSNSPSITNSRLEGDSAGSDEGIVLSGSNMDSSAEVVNNYIKSLEIGLRLTTSAGEASPGNLSISGNDFVDNKAHVIDESGNLNLDSVLTNNRFDVGILNREQSAILGADIAEALGAVQLAVDLDGDGANDSIDFSSGETLVLRSTDQSAESYDGNAAITEAVTIAGPNASISGQFFGLRARAAEIDTTSEGGGLAVNAASTDVVDISGVSITTESGGSGITLSGGELDASYNVYVGEGTGISSTGGTLLAERNRFSDNSVAAELGNDDFRLQHNLVLGDDNGTGFRISGDDLGAGDGEAVIFSNQFAGLATAVEITSEAKGSLTIEGNAFRDNAIHVSDATGGAVVDMAAVFENNSFDRAVLNETQSTILGSDLAAVTANANANDTLILQSGEFSATGLTLDKGLAVQGANSEVLAYSSRRSDESTVSVDGPIALDSASSSFSFDGIAVENRSVSEAAFNIINASDTTVSNTAISGGGTAIDAGGNDITVGGGRFEGTDTGIANLGGSSVPDFTVDTSRFTNGANGITVADDFGSGLIENNRFSNLDTAVDLGASGTALAFSGNVFLDNDAHVVDNTAGGVYDLQAILDANYFDNAYLDTETGIYGDLQTAANNLGADANLTIGTSSDQVLTANFADKSLGDVQVDALNLDTLSFLLDKGSMDSLTLRTTDNDGVYNTLKSIAINAGDNGATVGAVDLGWGLDSVGRGALTFVADGTGNITVEKLDGKVTGEDRALTVEAKTNLTVSDLSDFELRSGGLELTGDGHTVNLGTGTDGAINVRTWGTVESSMTNGTLNLNMTNDFPLAFAAGGFVLSDTSTSINLTGDSEASGSYVVEIKDTGFVEGNWTDLGAESVLKVDQVSGSVNVSAVSAGEDLGGIETLVLGDANFTATAAQLDLITGGNSEESGTVDAVDLGEDLVDLSGINQDRARDIYLNSADARSPEGVVLDSDMDLSTFNLQVRDEEAVTLTNLELQANVQPRDESGSDLPLEPRTIDVQSGAADTEVALAFNAAGEAITLDASNYGAGDSNPSANLARLRIADTNGQDITLDNLATQPTVVLDAGLGGETVTLTGDAGNTGVRNVQVDTSGGTAPTLVDDQNPEMVLTPGATGAQLAALGGSGLNDITLNDGATDSDLTVAGDLTLADDGNLTLTNASSAGGTFGINGDFVGTPDQLTLDSQNTGSSMTLGHSGDLAFADGGQLTLQGDGNISLNGGLALDQSGASQFTINNDVGTGTRDIADAVDLGNLNGTAPTFTLINQQASSLDFTGGLTVDGSADVTVETSAGDVNVGDIATSGGGAISSLTLDAQTSGERLDTGAIAFQAGKTLTMGGDGDISTGAVTAGSGNLTIDSTGASGAEREVQSIDAGAMGGNTLTLGGTVEDTYIGQIDASGISGQAFTIDDTGTGGQNIGILADGTRTTSSAIDAQSATSLSITESGGTNPLTIENSSDTAPVIDASSAETVSLTASQAINVESRGGDAPALKATGLTGTGEHLTLGGAGDIRLEDDVQVDLASGQAGQAELTATDAQNKLINGNVDFGANVTDTARVIAENGGGLNINGTLSADNATEAVRIAGDPSGSEFVNIDNGFGTAVSATGLGNDRTLEFGGNVAITGDVDLQTDEAIVNIDSVGDNTVNGNVLANNIDSYVDIRALGAGDGQLTINGNVNASGLTDDGTVRLTDNKTADGGIDINGTLQLGTGATQNLLFESGVTSGSGTHRYIDTVDATDDGSAILNLRMDTGGASQSLSRIDRLDVGAADSQAFDINMREAGSVEVGRLDAASASGTLDIDTGTATGGSPTGGGVYNIEEIDNLGSVTNQTVNITGETDLYIGEFNIPAISGTGSLQATSGGSSPAELESGDTLDITGFDGEATLHGHLEYRESNKQLSGNNINLEMDAGSGSDTADAALYTTADNPLVIAINDAGSFANTRTDALTIRDGAGVGTFVFGDQLASGGVDAANAINFAESDGGKLGTAIRVDRTAPVVTDTTDGATELGTALADVGVLVIDMGAYAAGDNSFDIDLASYDFSALGIANAGTGNTTDERHDFRAENFSGDTLRTTSDDVGDVDLLFADATQTNLELRGEESSTAKTIGSINTEAGAGDGVKLDQVDITAASGGLNVGTIGNQSTGDFTLTANVASSNSGASVDQLESSLDGNLILKNLNNDNPLQAGTSGSGGAFATFTSNANRTVTVDGIGDIEAYVDGSNISSTLTIDGSSTGARNLDLTLGNELGGPSSGLGLLDIDATGIDLEAVLRGTLGNDETFQIDTADAGSSADMTFDLASMDFGANGDLDVSGAGRIEFVDIGEGNASNNLSSMDVADITGELEVTGASAIDDLVLGNKIGQDDAGLERLFTADLSDSETSTVNVGAVTGAATGDWIIDASASSETGTMLADASGLGLGTDNTLYIGGTGDLTIGTAGRLSVDADDTFNFSGFDNNPDVVEALDTASRADGAATVDLRLTDGTNTLDLTLDSTDDSGGTLTLNASGDWDQTTNFPDLIAPERTESSGDPEMTYVALETLETSGSGSVSMEAIDWTLAPGTEAGVANTFTFKANAAGGTTIGDVSSFNTVSGTAGKDGFDVTGSADLTLGSSANTGLDFSTDGRYLNASAHTGDLDVRIGRDGSADDQTSIRINADGNASFAVDTADSIASNADIAIQLTNAGSLAGTWSGFGDDDSLTFTGGGSGTVNLTGINAGADLGGIVNVDLTDQDLEATGAQLTGISNLELGTGILSVAGIGGTGIDLSGYSGTEATEVSLGEGENDVTLDSTTNLGEFSIRLASDDTLTLTTFEQANTRTVNVEQNATNTTLAIDVEAGTGLLEIDASKYSNNIASIELLGNGGRDIALNSVSLADGQTLRAIDPTGEASLSLARAGQTGTANVELGVGTRNIAVSGETSGEETIDLALVENGSYTGNWSGFGGSDALTLAADADITGVSGTGGELGGIITVDIGAETLTATAAQVNAITNFSANGGTVNATGLADNSTVNLANVTSGAGTLTLGDSDVTLGASADLGDFDLVLNDSERLELSTVDQAEARKVDIAAEATGTTLGIGATDAIGATAIDASDYDVQISTIELLDSNGENLTLTGLTGTPAQTIDFSGSTAAATTQINDGDNRIDVAVDATIGSETITYDLSNANAAWATGTNLSALDFGSKADSYNYTITGGQDLTLNGGNAISFGSDGQILDAANFSGGLTASVSRSMSSVDDTSEIQLGEGENNLTVDSGTGVVDIRLTAGGSYQGTWQGFRSDDLLLATTTSGVDLSKINDGDDLGGLEGLSLVGGSNVLTASQIGKVGIELSGSAELDAIDLNGNSSLDLSNVSDGLSGTIGQVTLASSKETLATDTNLGDFDLALDNGDTVTLTNSSLQADARTISTTGTGANTTVAFDFGKESGSTVNASGFDANITEYHFENAGSGTSTFKNLTVNSGTTLDFSALDGGNFAINIDDGGSNTMTIGADAGTDVIDFDIGDSTWDVNNVPTFDFGSTTPSFEVTGSGTFDLASNSPLIFSANGQSFDASAFTGDLTVALTREGADTDNFDINLGQGANDITISGDANGNGTVSFVIPSEGMGQTTITGFGTEPNTATGFTPPKNDLLDFSNIAADLGITSVDDNVLTNGLEGLDSDSDRFTLGDLEFTRSGSDVEIDDTTDQVLTGPITIVAAEDDLSAGNFNLDGTT